MTWQEVRERFPHEWVLVEATAARSEDGRRIVDDVVVVDTFPSGETTFAAYAAHRRAEPCREFIPLHTDREQLDFEERLSLRVRTRP